VSEPVRTATPKPAGVWRNPPGPHIPLDHHDPDAQWRPLCPAYPAAEGGDLYRRVGVGAVGRQQALPVRSGRKAEATWPA